MQEKLIILRKKNNISQETISKYIGISKKSFCDKENGKYQFTIDEMFKIAEYFDMSIDQIFLPRILQNEVDENKYVK